MKYEYKIIEDQYDGSCDNEYELNELGKEGWELCAIKVSHWTGNSFFYFKREIKE